MSGCVAAGATVVGAGAGVSLGVGCVEVGAAVVGSTKVGAGGRGSLRAGCVAVSAPVVGAGGGVCCIAAGAVRIAVGLTAVAGTAS